MEKRAEVIYNHILKYIVEPLLGKESTYSFQIDKVGKKFFGNDFVGVFPSDKIPKLLNNQYAIVNLDTSDGIGSHWIAICKIDNKTLMYDSFGRASKHIIPSLLNSNNGKIYHADYDIEQEITENNCGPRSLSFLIIAKHWGRKFALLI